MIYDQFDKLILAELLVRTCCTYHRNAGTLRACMPELPEDGNTREFYAAYLPALHSEREGPP